MYPCSAGSIEFSQPRLNIKRYGELFRTKSYAYPAPYPEDTRCTRIREEMGALTVAVISPGMDHLVIILPDYHGMTMAL